MKKDNKAIWENWAEIALRVFPDVKEIDTIKEITAIESIISKFVSFNINRKGLKIIDICCGWGRHCFKLAEKGYQNITGVDISDTFIGHAVKRRSESQAKRMLGPRFIGTDIFALDSGDEYDLALNLWTSFGFFEEDEMNLSMLKKVRSFLKPEGLFILDLMNKERAVLKLNLFSDDEDYIVGRRHWWKAQDGVLGLTEANFDIRRSIITFYLASSNNREEKNKESTIALRLYDYSELSKLLESAGFEIKDVYGDFNLAPYSCISPRLFVIAKRKDNN